MVSDDAPDDDLAVEEDDHDINRVDYAARAADDVKPDVTFHTEGDEAEQELNEVTQQQVDLSCDALVKNLKHQWDHGSVMSIARRCAYIEINHIIDFINRNQYSKI